MHSVRLVPRHGASEWWMNVIFTGTVMFSGAVRGGLAPHSARVTSVTRPPQIVSIPSTAHTQTLGVENDH